MKLAISLAAGMALAATTALAEPVADGGRKFTTPMSGAEECTGAGLCGPPNAGDPDGSGTGSVTVNVGQQRVCWDFTVSNIDPPHMAHIHRAPAGTNGPVVVNFFTLSAGTAGPLNGCTATNLDRALLMDIIRNPSAFYLNLHNTPFPGGAIRGQLEK